MLETRSLTVELPTAAGWVKPVNEVSLDLAAGETLWKDAYFNWKSEPVRLEVKGEFDPRASAVGVYWLRLRVAF